MTSTPCGRLTGGPVESCAMGPDLALGIDLMLASSWHEIEDARLILRSASQQLPAERVEAMLASAARRIETVRAALSL